MRDRWLLLLCVGAPACGGEPTDKRTDAILALSGDPANGKVLYDANCVRCHGETGLGVDDPAGNLIGADLTKAAGETEEESEFIQYIIEGKEEMPAFGDEFDDQEIADLLAWLHGGLTESNPGLDSGERLVDPAPQLLRSAPPDPRTTRLEAARRCALDKAAAAALRGMNPQTPSASAAALSNEASRLHQPSARNTSPRWSNLNGNHPPNGDSTTTATLGKRTGP